MNTNRRAGTCNTGLHLSRRSLMKGLLTAAGGYAVANWGALTHSQTIAAQAKRSGKRCIMLYMEGGVSQIDTFDMKPGRTNGWPVPPDPDQGHRHPSVRVPYRQPRPWFGTCGDEHGQDVHRPAQSRLMVCVRYGVRESEPAGLRGDP